MAAKYAKLLLGCYRVGEANDPEVYTAAVIAVLSDYPEHVVRDVVDPRKGLPSKVQWLPTPKEVKDACEEIYGPIRRYNVMQDGIQRQLEERARIEEARRNAPKETWEETKADLARRGFNFGDKKPVIQTADEIMHKYRVSKEQWDAIPEHDLDFELKAKEAAEKAARR